MAALFVLGLKQSGFLRFQIKSFGRARAICTTSGSSVNESAPPKLTSPPWLLLPPDLDMSYKFYNLPEHKIERGAKLPAEHNDAVLVGSSHGWLAYFNDLTNHVFLSNPLSGRQLKLPPIHTLPDPEINLRDGRGSVSKVILSCSPDDDNDDCIALMSFGPGDRLAFCSLTDGRWNPIGRLFFKIFEKLEPPYINYGRAYEDFVYCTDKKVFSCITKFKIDLDRWVPSEPTEMEDWILRGPASPRSRINYWMRLLAIQQEGDSFFWLNMHKKKLRSCAQVPYLVFAEHNNKLYIVTRFVGVSDPYETVHFCVLEVVYNPNGLVVDKLRFADSLDGLAMFVGINHSFALPAAEFGLKPNSIYFTDVADTRLAPSAITYDVGIYDYECHDFVSARPYNFSHDQSLITGVAPLPPPVWFTPSLCD